MVFGPAFGIRHDALEDFDQGDDFDLEPGFFADFAPQRGLEPLTRFNRAARQ